MDLKKRARWAILPVDRIMTVAELYKRIFSWVILWT
jgi:hypothetical protein